MTIKELLPLKCCSCKSEMYQDDVDYNFKGNYDMYLQCPSCVVSARVIVRYNQVLRVNWVNDVGLCWVQKYRIEVGK